MKSGLTSKGLKSDIEKMWLIIWSAWFILSDLKKTQARTVKKKVIRIDENSLKLGNNLSAATISRLFRFFLKTMEGNI